MRTLISKHRFEASFFFMLLCYVLAKTLGLPPVYPAALLVGYIGLPVKELWTDIKKTLWLVLPVLFLALVFTQKLYTDFKVFSGFLSTLGLTVFFQHFFPHKTKNDFFPKGLLWASTSICVIFLIGMFLGWQNLAQDLTWAKFVSTWSRHDDMLYRLQLINAFSWNGDIMKAISMFSLLCNLTIWLASVMHPSSTKRGAWIGMSLLILVQIFLSSRGPLVVIAAMLACSFIERRTILKRVMITGTLLVPALVIFLSQEVLNGRKPLYDRFTSEMSWLGHGIGASAHLAQSISSGITDEVHRQNNYPHNIHLELIHDWGGLIYAIGFVGLVYVLMKQAALRTALVIFCLCSVHYTVYSPLTMTFVLIAWFSDLSSKESLGPVRS
jgi:hypothetical protein